MPDSFYEPDGEAYVATEYTRGPWDPRAQHAGPPAALIGREIERLGGGRMASGEGPSAQVGRVTYEILRSVAAAHGEGRLRRAERSGAAPGAEAGRSECGPALYDERGAIGRAVQTLLIAER